MDRWDGRTFRRVLMTDHQEFEVAVHQSFRPEAPQLQVELIFSAPPARASCPYRAGRELKNSSSQSQGRKGHKDL